MELRGSHTLTRPHSKHQSQRVGRSLHHALVGRPSVQPSPLHCIVQHVVGKVWRAHLFPPGRRPLRTSPQRLPARWTWGLLVAVRGLSGLQPRPWVTGATGATGAHWGHWGPLARYPARLAASAKLRRSFRSCCRDL